MKHLTAKELRIGNWVNYEGVNYQMHIVADEHPEMDSGVLYGCGTTSWENCFPVPVTEKILEDSGFKKTDMGNNEFYYSLDLGNHEYNDLALITGDKNAFLEVFLFPYEDFRYRYVHEIQNLYFSITKKELEIVIK
jgi:hypothetical protein